MKTIIIYEDKDILVVQKPSGLATQTARIGQADVVSELKNYLKQSYLGVVHRLDQPVEGLLVFAKNKASAAALTKQLAAGLLNKQYYAVICGQPVQKEGELVDYLLKKDNMAEVVTGHEAQYPDARKAVLQYRIVQEISAPELLTLLDIHIDTGRFHQIRVQMSHAKMALLGDNKYADLETMAAAQRMGIQNVALCAYSLCFKHPVSGKIMNYQIKPVGKSFLLFPCFEENNSVGN